MVCPSCAKENPSANAYCGSCGTVLNDVTAAIPRYGDQNRLMKREIAIVLGGLSLIFVVGWIAWYFLVTTRSPASVVRSFIESDRAGQFTRQQELITNSWDSRMALNFFQAVRQQSGSSPFQKYRILRSTDTRSSNAYVDVELTFNQPSIPLVSPPPTSSANTPATNKMTVTFVLTMQNDQWKIDSSQTLATVVSAIMAQGLQHFQANPPTLPNLPIPPGWPNLNFPPVSPAPSSPGTSPAPKSPGSPTI